MRLASCDDHQNSHVTNPSPTLLELHYGTHVTSCFDFDWTGNLLHLRGLDVRQVLSVTALLLAALGGDLRPVVREFLGTFSNEKFVVPICTALGFAYVLRLTECERHLVLLLVKPLRYFRWLLVPGVVLVGFLINIPVISQTSTAICLAPVVMPLMRSSGYSMATIGSCLLLGASLGGESSTPVHRNS